MINQVVVPKSQLQKHICQNCDFFLPSSKHLVQAPPVPPEPQAVQPPVKGRCLPPCHLVTDGFKTEKITWEFIWVHRYIPFSRVPSHGKFPKYSKFSSMGLAYLNTFTIKKINQI